MISINQSPFLRSMRHVLVLGVLLSASVQAQVETLDKVIAIIDDDVIMASELQERLDAVRANIAASGAQSPPEDLLVQETLDRLILESIQLQLAARYGVRIPDAQLDDSMQRIAAQNGLSLAQFRGALEAQGQSYLLLRENMRNELAIQRVQQGSVMSNINISEQEIDNYMATAEGEALIEPQYHVVQALLATSSADSSQAVQDKEAYVDSVLAAILAGQPYEEAVSTLEPYAFTGGDLGWRKVSDQPSMFADIVPTLAPGETGKVKSGSGFHLVYLAEARGIQEMVNQTEVRHILVVPTEVLSEEAAENLANSLRDRINAGEDFADLAKEFSDDIGSAQEGGSLGWTSPGQMVPEFEQQMLNAAEGEVTPAFQSPFGWHILEVTGRREKDFSNEMRRRQIANFLSEEKYQEELEAWLRKIRQDAFVDIK